MAVKDGIERLFFTCLFCGQRLPIKDKATHNCWKKEVVDA